MEGDRGRATPGRGAEGVRVANVWLPITFKRRSGTRHYVLRVLESGEIRVTLPYWGSRKEARAFVVEKTEWIARQWEQQVRSRVHPEVWEPGTQILWRGQSCLLKRERGWIWLDTEQVGPDGGEVDLRALVEGWLRSEAESWLPDRTWDLARERGLPLRRVSIRAQRARWGSCSSKGTVSLNWRLIHAPDSVMDYLIVHELMHLREMNHSSRFWTLVREACPDYRQAEAWLRAHQSILK